MANNKNGPSWVSIWEELCINLGFRLLHDGQRNPGQFSLPPEEVRFYTKYYQAVMDGEPIHFFVKFVYDEREGEVNAYISMRDPRRKDGAKRREHMKMLVPTDRKGDKAQEIGRE